MSDKLTPLCAIDAVPAGRVIRVEAGERTLAVYNIDGAFYATDDECTHSSASLADGILDGDIIECPLHFGCFHVPTGRPEGAPCSVPLRTYKVVVRDGQVFADLDKRAGE